MQARPVKKGGNGESDDLSDQMGSRTHVVAPGDLCGKQECVKYVKDLNKELAKYSSLVVALGSSTDSESLRDALRRSRKKTCDLARQNKHKLLPHLRCSVNMQEDKKEFENLWAAYSSCLELFETQMLRTLNLQLFFTFTSGAPILIQTGLQEAMLGHAGSHCRTHFSASVEHLDDAPTDRKSREKEDIKQLERDLHDIRDMLCNMQRLVDVNPWTVEPDIKIAEGIKSMSAGSEDDSTIDMQSTTDSVHETRRRKCICVLTTIASSIIVFATVLGLCLRFLT